MNTTPSLTIDEVKAYIQRSNKTGIIFDLDGTLVDSMPLHETAYREIFSRRGLKFLASTWELSATSGGHQWLEAMLIANAVSKDTLKATVSEIKSQKHELFEQDIDKLKRIPSTTFLLEKLALANKYKLACVTSASRRGADAMLETTNLGKFFHLVLTSSDIPKGRGKPCSDIYELALTKLVLDPQEVLAIEDSESGLHAALAAGVTCYALHQEQLHVGERVQ